MLKPLRTKPHRHVERARTMMAQDHDGTVGIELCMSPRRNVAHWHQGRTRQSRQLVLPWLTHIEEQGWVWLLQEFDKIGGSDLRG